MHENGSWPVQNHMNLAHRISSPTLRRQTAIFVFLDVPYFCWSNVLNQSQKYQIVSLPARKLSVNKSEQSFRKCMRMVAGRFKTIWTTLTASLLQLSASKLPSLSFWMCHICVGPMSSINHTTTKSCGLHARKLPVTKTEQSSRKCMRMVTGLSKTIWTTFTASLLQLSAGKPPPVSFWMCHIFGEPSVLHQSHKYKTVSLHARKLSVNKSEQSFRKYIRMVAGGSKTIWTTLTASLLQLSVDANCHLCLFGCAIFVLVQCLQSITLPLSPVANMPENSP